MQLSIKDMRLFAPVGALLLLFAIVQGFSLIHAAREANSVDAERTMVALQAALTSQTDRIAGIASDNAYWDDAAAAVYRMKPDLDFVQRSWGDSTGDGVNYDGAYVLDPSKHTLIGLRDGRLDNRPIERRLGKALAPLIARPQRIGGGVGTIVAIDGMPTLIGLATIHPTSNAGQWRMPAAGAYRLLLIRRLDNALLARIGRELVIDGLHVAPAANAPEVVPVRDFSGRPIAWLQWKPANPGMTALRRALPPIGVAMLAAILLTVMIGRQSARAVNELARQALVDSLSNLPNRRALRQGLTRRMAAGENVVLCLLDLDGFKFINDNYGHSVGDRLIIACAEMLIDLLGRGGFVARLGGDEFAFIQTGDSATANARSLAEKVLVRMSQPFRVGQRTVLIGASIGLAGSDGEAIDAGELLRRADVAMYAAKRTGKMRICAFDGKLDQHQARIHLIENELRASLAAKEFRVAYQPLFSASTGKIGCVEALMRWSSPTLGEMDPIDFIPVAEESGLIDPMGLFILRRACEETLGWPGIQLAVNVSAAQLRNPEFPSHVRQIIDETGFPASRLELEITETYLVSDPETAGKVLEGLRELGVSIALDDFGTGYASIGFLRQFSFDKLKIDRSLVVDAEGSEAARALLQASVAMARALNMEVAAEGVETNGQADLMRVAGCDQLQGWLFEKAMSAHDIARVLGLQAIKLDALSIGESRGPMKASGL